MRALALIRHTLGRQFEGHSVKLKLGKQVLPEQTEPCILSGVSELLPRCRAYKLAPADILKMVNHLVNEDRKIGGRSARPTLRKENCPRCIIVGSYDLAPIL